ncbi:signal transducer and activator of transcription 5A-like isoform X1 [Lutzomyia longipalpis]|uniref:signal transducer and activator of transcription 5A-like isoform X1 n=1 Tax=Lutzomyia longipalpis TaxID=7200 RepID=UPI0024837E46|nr:signal transducer and activator of transcription 5A-like isoform X1 [Lutzomyia longipalpis]XP_055677198.1 signal transducer and activator of transcription 5A-like isoform X1 [Lutzomyia longipalpis]
MALWAQTVKLPGEVMMTIKQHYNEVMPIEIRHFLAPWLEEHILPSMNMQMEYDQQHYEQIASNFLSDFILELETRAPEFTGTNVTVQLCFTEMAKKLRQRFQHDPVQLFNHLTRCLQMEWSYVNGCAMPYQNAEIVEVNEKLHTLTQIVAANEEENRQLKLDYERFSLEYHDLIKTTTYIKTITNQQELEQSKLQLGEQQKRLNDFLNAIQNRQLTLIGKIKDVIDQLQQAHELIMVKQLRLWKANQGLAGNGAPLNNNLDTIQQWCETLADNLWNTKTQIQILYKTRQTINVPIDPNLPDLLEPSKKEIINLLVKLVTASFVIEKQPPQVMKTNTRFTATVRLLVGPKLNIQMNSPSVRVSIVSETQAQHVQQSNQYSEALASGEILNNSGTLEYQQATNQVSVSFRNMQLKKIKRAEKKGTESVMDEKFALLFQSKFQIGSGELVITAWALSLPVVVIVHGNQEPQSWATITWDNAFADPTRIPFQVPDKVPWPRLADALNMKFKAATGRCLTEANLQFLCEKAFRHGTPNTLNQNEMYISWAQFCKEPLPDRTYTFWEWFYAVMKLTREHLRNPWQDGLIIGFIHKKQAEDMLMKCPVGTFLLRFSDSELGGVTIAWVGDGNDGQLQIFMLQPFLAKDFAIRSLPDHIADLTQLCTLYPDISKEKAFGKYYTAYPSQANNGYVVRRLVTQVPGVPMGSYPNTPSHSMSIQSPDHTRDTPSISSSYGQPGISLGNDIGMMLDDFELGIFPTNYQNQQN